MLLSRESAGRASAPLTGQLKHVWFTVVRHLTTRLQQGYTESENDSSPEDLPLCLIHKPILAQILVQADEQPHVH